MNEKALEFYEAISADDALQEELVAVTGGVDLGGLSEEEALQAMAEAVAEFATAHDLDLTAADVLEAHDAVTSGELSEEELAAVDGGGVPGCILGGGGSHRICVVVGSEPSDCQCVMYGAGK